MTETPAEALKAGKPDCATCGKPYWHHNVGAITTCPIYATYRPKAPPAADAGEVREGSESEIAWALVRSLLNAIEGHEMQRGHVVHRDDAVQIETVYERAKKIWPAMERAETALSPQAPSPTFADGGWEPIETAPKDGTWIDLWIPSDAGGYRLSDAFYSTCYKGWRHAGDAGSPTLPRWPTHWRPLPAPPAAAIRGLV